MSELLIIILIISFLALTLTFLLGFVVKKTNSLMKNVFVDKMSEFDFLLEDKEKKVDELNDDIKKKAEIITQLEEKSKGFSGPDTVLSNEVVMPKFTDFEDGNIFSNYKVIKEKFNYDPTTLIKQLISKNNNNDFNRYNVLKKIRSYFTFDVIYRISQYQTSEQYEIVTSLLSKEELSCLGEIDKEHFKLKKIIDKIDGEIIKTDPLIRVLVGDERKNYDSMDKSIVTEYDKNITEGFKIIYKGVIYDYSI